MQHLYIWGSQCQDEFQEIYHEEMRTSVGKKEIKTRTNKTLLGITSDIKSPNREFYQIFFSFSAQKVGFPNWFTGKEHACQCRRCKLDPWVGNIPWRRKGQPIRGFLPEESHGHKSLKAYSPRSRKESDRTSHWPGTHSNFCSKGNTKL